MIKNPLDKLLDNVYIELAKKPFGKKEWFYFELSCTTFHEILESFHRDFSSALYQNINLIEYSPPREYLKNKFAIGLLVHGTTYLPFILGDVPQGKVIIRKCSEHI